ncbi:MAG TPA: DUF4255 domain-containing protein [Actinomycetota bacterium]|nr:DUF4255 domain-containing protein [Actinomycetota bacterium]
MIHDVDDALRALIERDAVAGSGVEVSLDAPSKAWAARRSSPTVNVYLYDIREDVERRGAQYEEVRRNVDGRDAVVDRRMPPRLFCLAYLVSAWTQRPEDEHRLLSAILACLLRNPALPRELLSGSLAGDPAGGTPPPLVKMTVGLPASKDRKTSDVWGALGGELKPALDVVITAPFDPQMRQEVGPLVTQPPVVHVRDADRQLRRGRRR